ncbi:DNA repair protein RAD50 [Sipha flava]|uniref:DNA repair protein RAD50 n=1 Tax=Sipha flava TaxID=143950 RepID=A0A2S2QS01_9HEMI|nr:DNA repair protein RAD50 [Sipha flava]XP_025414139.1 DNA repair protein RAD50 [Sipha flava]
MSTLEEISIQGIRSYHPHEKQSLKFQKPLTLILGQNGCGKTTIIECLKYVTCSDQPKNTKSGGFVWDPKLSDYNTVKGNVKLLFRDIKDISVVVSKTLESTQKLKTVTTKSLDQTISRKGQSTSHKCTNIDEVMCDLLGVSKSILKDVVFCHQEDSNWPLDEDKKVKEKFDSIFDVGKYDKCIKQVRDKIKLIGQEKKIADIELEHLKNYREEARTKRSMLDNKNCLLEELEKKMNIIDNDLKPVEDRFIEILHIEDNLSVLKNSLLTSQGRLKSLKLAQKELKSVIKVKFEGNDFEIDDAIMNFKNNLIRKNEEKKTLIDKKNNSISDENRIQEKINKEQINLGSYQNEEKQYQNNMQKQSTKITEIAREMETILPALTKFNRIEVIRILSNELKSMNDKLECIQKENYNTEIKLQSNIDYLRVEKAKLDQEIKIKEKHFLENSSEIKNLSKDVEQVKYLASKLTILEKSKVDNETKLRTLNASFDIDEIKSEINMKKEEKNKLNLKLEVVEKEVQQLQLFSSVQAELDSVLLNKSGIVNKLKKLQNKVNDVLNDLLGYIPEEKLPKLKFVFTKFLNNLTDSVKVKRKMVSEMQREYTTLEANYNHTQETLRRKQRDLSDDELAMSDMCLGQEYDVLVKEVNEKVEELQNQKGSVSTSGHLFRRYIKSLEAKDPCCPLCHRGFDSMDEVTELINDLNVRVDKIPNELETTTTQLETLLEKQSKLQQLKPTYTRIAVLNNTEIPKLKDEIEMFKNKSNKCRKELSTLSDTLEKLENTEATAKSILSDVIMIDSYYNDIQRYINEEQRLISKINETGSTRSIQEALSEQSTLKKIINNIYNTLEKKQHELSEYNETLHALQIAQNQIVSDELNIKRKLQDEKVMMNKLNDLQNLEATLSIELESSRKSIIPIENQLETCIKNFDQIKKQHEQNIENKRKEIMFLEKKFQEINNLETLINDYEKKEWSLRIKEVNNLIDNLIGEKVLCVENQMNIQKQIDSINEYNANQEIQKIDLENNKKLRQKINEENECLSEIHKLKKKVGNLDVDDLMYEKKSNREKSETLHKERNQISGRVDELYNVISSIRLDLSAIPYLNAEHKYLHKKVNLEILKRVESDLSKYAKALEWALNRFHTDHMQSINTIIKNLWRDIYTGNDIDYIQIKTSDDNKPISTDSSKKRVFNYKVVQIKNDIELDMRGRCSAGQKVLACLIVRMALAETFSKNCGILALDEPTTNLDESNIQSLAEALSGIVQRRSLQKSFQLIIITHDPSFLNKLSARDLVDTYYEVKRNNDGISIVEEMDIKLLP